jgi:hypothetical protein
MTEFTQGAAMIRAFRELIRTYWEKNVAPRLNDLGKNGVEPLSDRHRLWNQLVDAGGCVDCDKQPKGFYEGPSGGMSQNVFCSQCGQGYNLTPVAHWAERIHKDEAYIQPMQEWP